MTQPNHSIHDALTSRTLDVAEAVLGVEPTSIGKTTARWRSRGSLAVTFRGKGRGLWCDHESGEGGDLIALIARERGVDRDRAYEIARVEFCGLDAKPLNRPRRAEPTRDVEVPTRTIALNQWADAKRSINDTPAATYLKSRGIEIEGDSYRHVLRWHAPASALIALMTDPQNGEPCGIHRTFLDASAQKRERKMLGNQGVIRIAPDDDVTGGLGICEGLEDALSIELSGWSPVWAATSAGAIARFPILNGIECLTIFSDRDEAGVKASKTCADRWRSAGQIATVVIAGGSAHV